MTLTQARQVFADLMQKARTGSLTDADRRQLTRARQLLRRAKRPAMNPDILRFSDLHIGEKFEFDRTGVEFSGMASGPWIKTGPRTYRPAISDTELMGQLKRQYGSYATRGMLKSVTRNRVGSVNVAVVRVGDNPLTRTRKLQRNPSGSILRLGRATEVRYKREVGRKPGFYKHAIESRRAGVYTIPAGWVYVAGKSILISESVPRGRR